MDVLPSPSDAQSSQLFTTISSFIDLIPLLLLLRETPHSKSSDRPRLELQEKYQIFKVKVEQLAEQYLGVQQQSSRRDTSINSMSGFHHEKSQSAEMIRPMELPWEEVLLAKLGSEQVQEFKHLQEYYHRLYLLSEYLGEYLGQNRKSQNTYYGYVQEQVMEIASMTIGYQRRVLEKALKEHIEGLQKQIGQVVKSVDEFKQKLQKFSNRLSQGIEILSPPLQLKSISSKTQRSMSMDSKPAGSQKTKRVSITRETLNKGDINFQASIQHEGGGSSGGKKRVRTLEKKLSPNPNDVTFNSSQILMQSQDVSCFTKTSNLTTNYFNCGPEKRTNKAVNDYNATTIVKKKNSSVSVENSKTSTNIIKDISRILQANKVQLVNQTSGKSYSSNNSSNSNSKTIMSKPKISMKRPSSQIQSAQIQDYRKKYKIVAGINQYSDSAPPDESYGTTQNIKAFLAPSTSLEKSLDMRLFQVQESRLEKFKTQKVSFLKSIGNYIFVKSESENVNVYSMGLGPSLTIDLEGAGVTDIVDLGSPEELIIACRNEKKIVYIQNHFFMASPSVKTSISKESYLEIGVPDVVTAMLKVAENKLLLGMISGLLYFYKFEKKGFKLGNHAFFVVAFGNSCPIRKLFLDDFDEKFGIFTTKRLSFAELGSKGQQLAAPIHYFEGKEVGNVINLSAGRYCGSIRSDDKEMVCLLDRQNKSVRVIAFPEMQVEAALQVEQVLNFEAGAALVKTKNELWYLNLKTKKQIPILAAEFVGSNALVAKVDVVKGQQVLQIWTIKKSPYSLIRFDLQLH